jgi:predicted DNA-binding ribbon-helix-helix protein
MRSNPKPPNPDHELARLKIVVGGNKVVSTVSLEKSVWKALREAAAEQGKTVHQLVMEIDSTRTLNRSAAIRVYLIDYYKAALERARQG